jgi:hypothetical protein
MVIANATIVRIALQPLFAQQRLHFGTPSCRQIWLGHTKLTWHHESNEDQRIRRIQLNSNDMELPIVVNLIGMGDKALQIIISQVLN